MIPRPKHDVKLLIFLFAKNTMCIMKGLCKKKKRCIKSYINGFLYESLFMCLFSVSFLFFIKFPFGIGSMET